MLKRVRDSFRGEGRLSDTGSGLNLQASAGLTEDFNSLPSGLERETISWHKGGATSLARGEVLRRGACNWAPWIGRLRIICMFACLRDISSQRMVDSRPATIHDVGSSGIWPGATAECARDNDKGVRYGDALKRLNHHAISNVRCMASVADTTTVAEH